MTYGALTVGRLVLAEPFKVSESADRLTLTGQESLPPSTRAAVYGAYRDLLALDAGQLVPVLFTDKPERDGFYTVSSASSDLTDWQGEIVTADWKLDLARAGTAGEVDAEAKMTARARDVAAAVTGTHWHGVPVGATAYDTGATLPLTIARTGEDGTVPVYYSVPPDVAPRWYSTAAGYRLGRARILDATREVSGRRDVAAGTWEVANSLVRIRPLTGGGSSPSLEIARYNSGAWQAKQWALYADADMLGPWSSAVILRNDFERVTLRLTGARPAGGRHTLDISLRRGSRFAELEASTGVAALWTLDLWSAEAATATGNYRAASGDDAAGLRFQAGSTRAFGAAGNGGLVTTVASQHWSGWVGAQAGGSPAPGESFADMQQQYVGAPGEVVTAVAR